MINVNTTIPANTHTQTNPVEYIDDDQMTVSGAKSYSGPHAQPDHPHSSHTRTDRTVDQSIPDHHNDPISHEDINLDLNFDLDMQSLHKMLLVYNAILNGWTVKTGQQTGTFEFTKRKNAVKKELLLDNYLEHFAQENLNLDLLLKPRKKRNT